MKEKLRDLKKWSERADYDTVLAMTNHKHIQPKADVHYSASFGNQSVEVFKSALSHPISNSDRNEALEMQN